MFQYSDVKCDFHLILLGQTVIIMPAYPDDEHVHQAIQMGPFEYGLATVLHELGVLPREHDKPVAPLGVSQNTTTQQNLLIVDRVLFAVEL